MKSASVGLGIGGRVERVAFAGGGRGGLQLVEDVLEAAAPPPPPRTAKRIAMMIAIPPPPAPIAMPPRRPPGAPRRSMMSPDRWVGLRNLTMSPIVPRGSWFDNRERPGPGTC